MKRDIDLIRKILVAIEEVPAKTHFKQVRFEGINDDVVNYHLMLLNEAGLIEAIQFRGGTSFGDWVPQRLTWEGHEFLDAARNETVWNNTKEVVKEKGGSIPFELLKDLLIKGATAYFGLS